MGPAASCVGAFRIRLRTLSEYSVARSGQRRSGETRTGKALSTLVYCYGDRISTTSASRLRGVRRLSATGAHQREGAKSESPRTSVWDGRRSLTDPHTDHIGDAVARARISSIDLCRMFRKQCRHGQLLVENAPCIAGCPARVSAVHSSLWPVQPPAGPTPTVDRIKDTPSPLLSAPKKALCNL